MAPKAPARLPARVVGDVLRGYVERGVLRSVSHEKRRGTRTGFTMIWHHGRSFQLELSSGAVSFPALLPGVTSGSPMAKDLRAFLRRFETEEVPAHRRIDPRKARLRVAVRRGRVSLGLSVKHGEYDYCTRRLVHLVQEVFMVFLPDGPYHDYRIETLGLDPERVWA